MRFFPAILLVVQSAPAITLGEVERSSPSTAAKSVFGKPPPAPIANVARKVDHDVGVPGQAAVDLIEVPKQITGGGCARGRWTATFKGQPGTGASAWALDRVLVTEELRLAEDGACPSGNYAVYGGADRQAALALLHEVAKIASGRRKVRFVCSSATDLLCTSDETVRSSLAVTPVWAIMPNGRPGELWLGRNGIVTTVRLHGDTSAVVTVTRAVPAPY